MRRDAIAYLRVLGRRYLAIPVAAGFLALVATVFPTTVPLGSAGSLGRSAPATAAPAGAPAKASPARQSSASGGEPLYPSAGGESLPGASTTMPAPLQPVGAGYPASAAPSYSTPSGSGPAPIPQAPPVSGSQSCPLPEKSPPGPVIPQAYALFQALTGLCEVLVSLPGLAGDLPSLIAGLPGDLQSGQLPPQVNQLIQKLGFQVIIPLLSVLPSPSSSSVLPGLGGMARAGG